MKINLATLQSLSLAVLFFTYTVSANASCVWFDTKIDYIALGDGGASFGIRFSSTPPSSVQCTEGTGTATTPEGKGFINQFTTALLTDKTVSVCILPPAEKCKIWAAILKK